MIPEHVAEVALERGKIVVDPHAVVAQVGGGVREGKRQTAEAFGQYAGVLDILLARIALAMNGFE